MEIDIESLRHLQQRMDDYQRLKVENEDLQIENKYLESRIVELKSALTDALEYIRSLKARLGDEYEG